MTDTEREDAIIEIAQEHGLDEDAFLTYCDNFHIGSDYADHVNEFQDAYQGCYDDLLEFATILMDDTMDIPDHLAHYIDYEAFARDLRCDYWEEHGHVFRNL